MEARVHAALTSMGVASYVLAPRLAEALCKQGLQLTDEPHPGSVVAHPSKLCSCGSTMHEEPGRATEAAVLDVAGWITVKHVPLRCRSTECERCGKRIWYNFIGEDRATHTSGCGLAVRD